MTDQENKEKIERLLYLHGQLSILFYRSNGLFIVHKYGVYESLESEYEKLVTRLQMVGWEDEVSTVSLMELPKDADEIFKIIHCGGLKSFLEKNGIKI